MFRARLFQHNRASVSVRPPPAAARGAAGLAAEGLRAMGSLSAEEQELLLLLAAMADTAGDEVAATTALVALAAALEERERDLTRGAIDLDTLSPARCVERFRVDAAGIRRMAAALRLPETISEPQRRCVVRRDEAMCILLRRLCYPARWADLEAEFGRSSAFLCTVFLHMVELIDERYAADMRLNPAALAPRLRSYADAIAAKGAPLDVCFGFVDGTAWQVCRPSWLQREVYSGHKRYHCLKFQAVQLPDGIIADLSGPWAGRRHDQFMLVASELEQRLSSAVFDGYVLYGDEGYTYSEHIAVPFRTAYMTEERRAFNDGMAAVRVSVEWGFMRVKQLFAYLAFVPSQRIYSSPVAKLYRVAVLLTNMITCMNGASQASDYFHCAPPSLDDYMAWFPARRHDA